MGEALFK